MTNSAALRMAASLKDCHARDADDASELASDEIELMIRPGS